MDFAEQPTGQSRSADLALEVAALRARVEALERRIAELRPAEHAPQETAVQSAAPPPRPAAPPSFAAAAQPRPAVSLETRVGSQLFNRIGIIALLIGAALFLKHAMDNHWVGPLGRVLIGLIAGAGIVLWSERFRRKGFGVFSYSLKAVGTGILYLALWAAFQVFHLLPASAALAAMVLVTAWNAFMAWSQSSELLAAYALAGAFATPLLLSTGGNHEAFLFTYILVIDIAAVALVLLKLWPRLLFGAFPATVAFFIAWYAQFNSADALAMTSVFAALFWLVFIAPSVGRPRETQPSSEVVASILLPLANAIFAALAFYSLLEDAGHHALLPWTAVLFAAAYLGLMRAPQTQATRAVHLSLAIVFLTVAIPLKASGSWLTVGWFAEGAALLWTSTLVMAPAAETTPANVHRVLRVLALCALLLGFFSLSAASVWHIGPDEAAFFNRRFATSLFGIAALAVAAWIAHRAAAQHDATRPSWSTIAASSIIALNLVALSACVQEIDTAFRPVYGHLETSLQRSLAISGFLMLYGAALLAIGFWKRSAFIRWQAIVLLVFTIGKTFLYDIRNLSQGYRIVSFIALGVLLMVISFAYQKDWLALRAPAHENEPHDAPKPASGAHP